MSIATKKILLVYLTLSLLALVPDLSFANAQGACSWHGGVNCSYGRDYDGSVVCNDGWKDSSTEYEYTQKCKTQYTSEAIQALVMYQQFLDNDCRNTGLHPTLSLNKANKYRRYYSPTRKYAELTLCLEDENRILKYDSWSDNLLACSDIMDSDSANAVKKLYNEKKKECDRAWCYNIKNAYLTENGECLCESGFTVDSNTNTCVESEPCPFENSYLSNNFCYCNQGYQWNNDQTACVKTTLNIAPQPEPEIEPTQKIESEPQSRHTQIFTDINNSPNFDAILFLNSRGIIKGYDDKTFRPNNTVNRAELVKILVTGKGMTPSIEEYKNCFSDVTTDWFAPYICYAKSKYWISGYPDGTFKPNQTVNKAEAIKMLLNSQGTGFATRVESKPFSDVEVTDWFAPYIKKAKELGILEETGALFSPADGMSRGGIAENLYRLIK